MKNLDKNQSNPVIVAQHQAVLDMQQRLASACLAQGLKISTTIGREKGTDLPYLQYAISFNSDEPVVFHGQARTPDEPHYKTMFDLVNGKMVSEVFPPAIRSVQREPQEGSNVPVEVPISYWKRRLVVEHDITQRDPDPKASRTDGLHKVYNQTVWCGYDTNSQEIIRVADGSNNSHPEDVDRVQYMEMGPRGTVIVVIFKDTVRLQEGQQGTFAEALKTAQAGFQEGGQTSGVQDMSYSSSAGAPVFSKMDVSLSSGSGSSTASSGPGLPMLDLSGMKMASVVRGRPIPQDSELGKAISRLSKKGRPQPTMDIPKTMLLDTLARNISQSQNIPAETQALVLRVAGEVGVKNPSLSSRVGQDKAVAIAEKFGYKVTRLSEGGGRATTNKVAVKTAKSADQKLPSSVTKSVQKNVARKTAVKKAPIKKPAGKKTKTND